METIRAIALLLISNSLPGHLPEAITLIQLQVGLITGMEIMRAVLYTLTHPLMNYSAFKIANVKGNPMSGEDIHHHPSDAR